MKTLKLLTLCCSITGFWATGASGGDVQLLPISASGSHNFDGDEIILHGGGQRVWLEIYIWGWAPRSLLTWQVEIDSNGYSSGDLGTIGPAIGEACSGFPGGNPTCVAAFGTGATCEYPTGVNTHCTPGFIDTSRGDYIFPGADLPAVDMFSLDFRFGSLSFVGGITDPGTVLYAGTLVLDVPVGAVGTFTIGMNPDPGTWLKDPTYAPITPLNLTAGVVTVNCQVDADCDDGDACTDDDCLGNGSCSYSLNYNPAIHCCDPDTGNLTPIDDGNECTDNVCDSDTGIVSHPPVAYGVVCGPAPSDPCDAQDICDGNGTCIPQWAPNGTACGNPSDTDCTDPDTCDGGGNCQDNHEPGGTLCGDQTDDDCTDPDTCDGGGNCDDNHEPAGTFCGDPTDTDCDNPDTCDGGGGCLDNLESNGTTCDDGLYCNINEACQNGNCIGGSARDCGDGLGCTTDTCDENLDQCDNDLDPGFCLISGNCRSDGQTNPSNECEDCNTQLSTTAWSPKPLGTVCGSGADTDCTDPDTCDGASACQDNHELVGTLCGDQSDTDCTDPDTCDGNGACDDNHAPNGTSCDDLLYCNVSEACQTGNCAGGTPRNCSDSVPCTDDWCNEGMDQCENDANDANCNNGQWCDGVEICDSILNCVIQPGTVPDCDDQVPCTDDWCNEGLDQCENDENDANCNNGDWCDGVEICDGVADCIIEPGSVPNCDDSIGCTDDSCDEVNDECVNAASDAYCPDDGEFCNGTEYCNPETDCDHTGNPCAGPCDPIEGCLCEAPIINYELVSPRYIPIAMQPPGSGDQAIVLTVDCPAGDVVLYAGEPFAEDLDGDGTDDESVAIMSTDPGFAAWHTPEEWGELYVTGALVLPDVTYSVQGDCGQPGSPGLSDPSGVTTAIWGDVVGDYLGGVWTVSNGIVDFVDIASVIDRFRAISYAPMVNRVDLCGPNGNECVPQQNFIDFVDVLSCVEAFRGKTYSQTWTGCPLVCE